MNFDNPVYRKTTEQFVLEKADAEMDHIYSSVRPDQDPLSNLRL